MARKGLACFNRVKNKSFVQTYLFQRSNTLRHLTIYKGRCGESETQPNSRKYDGFVTHQEIWIPALKSRQTLLINLTVPQLGLIKKVLENLG
jgi:hypothetical protein